MQNKEVTIRVDTAQAAQLLAELREIVMRFESSVQILSALCAVLDKTISIPKYPKSFA